MDWLKRRQERKAGERQERDNLRAEQQAALDAESRIVEAAERAYKEEIVEDLGVVAFQRNGNIKVTVANAAEKKLAIKELRLKKKELTAQKRELTAEIAAIRAEYRGKVAGRYSTAALPRGTTGRIMRAGVQAKRRSERMEVDNAIVPIEQKRNAIDNRMITIDRTIARLDASAFTETDR
jgi:hypothetical protein